MLISKFVYRYSWKSNNIIVKRNSNVSTYNNNIKTMEKKTLFIEPFYFYNGHYFGLFNNLVNNLSHRKNVSFLVSVNNKINNFIFKKGLNNIKKKADVLTFNSVKKSDSNWNVLNAFIKVIKLNKKFDIFYFQDANIPIVSLLYLSFWPILYNKKLTIYVFYGPEVFNKSFLKRILVKIFLSFKNNKIFTRTKHHSAAWQNYFSNKKNISYLDCYDFPNIDLNLKKTGKLKCGVIGQIRLGKSIEYLHNYFANNKNEGIFYIIGNFTDNRARNNFKFLNKKFVFTENFHSSNKISKVSSSLDYICLLYDVFFDYRQEVSTLFLAARLRSPVICFNKKGWLLEQVKKYNCGIILKSINDFKKLPKRNSKKYKSLIKGLKKFDLAKTGKSTEEAFYNKVLS